MGSKERGWEDRVVEAGRRVGGQMVREERRWKEREEDERGEDGKGGEKEDETILDFVLA